MGLFIMYLIVGVIITLLVVSFYRSITRSDTNNKVNNVSVDTVDVSTTHRDHKNQSQVHVKSNSSFDWTKHKWDLEHKSSISSSELEFIEWKVIRDTYYLQGVEDGIRMIEELKEYSERLKRHFSVENFKEVPTDPEQQTELQKLIVNAPPIPKSRRPFNYEDYIIQDPETGMYYHKITGIPSLPPEWDKYYSEYLSDDYDYSRGKFYNFMRKVFSGEGPGL